MKETIDSFRDEYAFLSNFYYAEVELDGVKYPTVENAFQAAKTNDSEARKAFETVPPNEAKKLGQQVNLSKFWNSQRVDVMKDLLKQKFNIPKFKEKLLATGSAYLIEGNWWHDNSWGICNCDNCKSTTTPRSNSNLLGRLLTEVRYEIKPITCHTGGAKGSDMLFETLSVDNGFNVTAYSFDGHSTKSTNRKLLTQEELDSVTDKVTQVGFLIRRNAPLSRPQILQYLQRDIYQVLDSEVVFAIGTLEDKTQMPYGGTAWAVGMAVINRTPVWFFDQEKKQWLFYDEQKWVHEPFPHNRYFKVKDFTGIGTREINDTGKQAIQDIIEGFKIIRSNYVTKKLQRSYKRQTN